MAKESPKERKRIIKKLRNRYRLVVMNDTTFDERFSAFLTPLNVISGITLAFLVMASFVLVLIVFTPLREYIPGYGDTETRLNALAAAVKADSLEKAQEQYANYFDNVHRVLTGEVGNDSLDIEDEMESKNYGNLDFSTSTEDSVLRQSIESQERYALLDNAQSKSNVVGLPGVLFFQPMKGTVTDGFDASIKHYGVDITAREGEPIMSVYDGVVVFSSFTSDGGYVIQVQHPNNLISIYKHNSVLLKEVGEQVKAGETIAIIGNTGKYTDGPHLHFELWHNGSPVDPQEYIAFTSES